jgi:hypothetical protein
MEKLTTTGHIPAGMEAGGGDRGRPGQTQTRARVVDDGAEVGAIDGEGRRVACIALGESGRSPCSLSLLLSTQYISLWKFYGGV